MNSKDRKAYGKEYYQSHKEERKAYYQARKQERKAYQKAYTQSHKEERKAYRQAHREEHNAYQKAYIRSDINSVGQTKNNIRAKSRRILKRMNLYIPHYEIHHCFGYEDPSKFIYCSRALHSKIHQYLRDNNISANSNHWMYIRDLVNSTYEFVYIKD